MLVHFLFYAVIQLKQWLYLWSQRPSVESKVVHCKQFGRQSPLFCLLITSPVITMVINSSDDRLQFQIAYLHGLVIVKFLSSFLLLWFYATSFQELSSLIELSHLLDQSSGTPSLNPSDQSTTYTRLNTFWKHAFLTNLADFISLHSAAILTVLCYSVLPSRSGSCTLGIKDTFIRLD